MSKSSMVKAALRNCLLTAKQIRQTASLFLLYFIFSSVNSVPMQIHWCGKCVCNTLSIDWHRLHSCNLVHLSFQHTSRTARNREASRRRMQKWRGDLAPSKQNGWSIVFTSEVSSTDKCTWCMQCLPTSHVLQHGPWSMFLAWKGRILVKNTEHLFPFTQTENPHSFFDSHIYFMDNK